MEKIPYEFHRDFRARTPESPLFVRLFHRFSVSLPQIYASQGTNEQIQRIRFNLPPVAGGGFEHTIERGETVYAIATMYGVSVDDIYRLNPESKEGIKAGDKLRIPQKDAATQTASSKKAGDYLYHAIKRGETLYALSQEYDIPAQAILDANPGLSVSTFAAGRIIRIPPTRIEGLPTTEQKETVKEIESAANSTSRA